VTRALRLLLCCGVAVVGVGRGATSASATAPSEQGWWTTLNPGTIGGVGLVPAPPDVPAKGMLVEGGPGSTPGASDGGALAYGAVLYKIPAGAELGSLTLTVAPDSLTTPDSALELCALDHPALPNEQGGPEGDAPAYDCRTHVTAQPSSSGSSYRFDAAALASGDELAVAILPTSPVDRVVLAEPDVNSLSLAPVQTVPGAAGGGSGAPAPVTIPSSASDVRQTPSTDLTVAQATGNSGSALPVGPTVNATSTPADTMAISSLPATPTSTPTPQRSPSSSDAAQFAATQTGPPGAKPWAVGLLLGAFLVGGTGWVAVGSAAVRAARKT
jgi:hypothetical protein